MLKTVHGTEKVLCKENSGGSVRVRLVIMERRGALLCGRLDCHWEGD